MTRFAVSTIVAGGLFAGLLGAAGAAGAESMVIPGNDGTTQPATPSLTLGANGIDASLPGGPKITLGPNGIVTGLPGGAAVKAGPTGVGASLPTVSTSSR